MVEQKENFKHSDKAEIYRFRLMQGNVKDDGTFERKKKIGMAYLVDGTSTYNLKLWTFLKDRFHLVPRKNDSSEFLVLTRDWSRNPNAKNKSFSNIVGNGKALPLSGIVKIDFDLLDKSIFMSLYPEVSSHRPQQEVFNEAA